LRTHPEIGKPGPSRVLATTSGSIEQTMRRNREFILGLIPAFCTCQTSNSLSAILSSSPTARNAFSKVALLSTCSTSRNDVLGKSPLALALSSLHLLLPSRPEDQRRALAHPFLFPAANHPPTRLNRPFLSLVFGPIVADELLLGKSAGV